MGRKALALYREGQLDKTYLKEADNEVKKLTYLIEQKESHKKELKEESLRTTFINFLKESVYRFSLEKRVEHRIMSLQERLDEVYASLGRRLMQEYSSTDLDLIKLGDLPVKISKLSKQIEALQERLEASQAPVGEVKKTQAKASDASVAKAPRPTGETTGVKSQAKPPVKPAEKPTPPGRSRR
jgi:hypothetical protein